MFQLLPPVFPATVRVPAGNLTIVDRLISYCMVIPALDVISKTGQVMTRLKMH